MEVVSGCGHDETERKIQTPGERKIRLTQKIVSPALLRGIPRIELGTSRTRSEHYATKPNPRDDNWSKNKLLDLLGLFGHHNWAIMIPHHDPGSHITVPHAQDDLQDCEDTPTH